MLEINIPSVERFDETTGEFINIKGQTLRLEHSLVSLSKWESKWCKPFLVEKEKTYEEMIDYIKCMTLNQNVDPEVYKGINKKILKEIMDYIEAPMTATWFRKEKKSNQKGEQVTAELIYYWMISLQIPFECQKWHLNRLLTLVKVCNAKNAPQKNMSKREIMSSNKELNDARRKALHTKG